MCFFSVQSKTAQELQNRFKATFNDSETYSPSTYNGFQHPKTPVITNIAPKTIQLFNWGLIPKWATNENIKKYTLNARIETIHEKPAFKSATNKRCLVLATGFYEWQWLDSKGKEKQKYIITLPNNEAFAFAGLFSEWINKNSGEIIHTYTIITTQANTLMSEIHNTKKRMPVILDPLHEEQWLTAGKIKMQNEKLIAEKTYV